MPRSRHTRFLILAALVAVVAWPVRPVYGADEPNPLLAQVKASLKDPAKPFTMIVVLRPKEGSEEKFEAAMAKAVKATRKEKGCIAYELHRDTKTPGQYVMWERWRNLGALESHLKAEYITGLLKELPELLSAGPELRVLVPVGD